jgi:hypothetical protein
LQRESIVKTSLPNHLVARIQGDDFERRARLICLVYEVLRSMEPPADGATDMAMLSALTRAFSDKTIALANLEADAPGRNSRTLKPT